MNYPVAYVDTSAKEKPKTDYAGEIKFEEFKKVRGDLHVHYYEKEKKATYSIDLVGLQGKVLHYKEHQKQVLTNSLKNSS